MSHDFYKGKRAMFVIKHDRREQALEVAKRYGIGIFWLIYWHDIGEIATTRPPRDYKPYAQVESYAGGDWSRAR